MKVLAVVARSWYAGSVSRHTTFDYCDTTHCQYLKEPDARSLAAASATRDLILQWQRRPVAALYSSSCGGRTLTAAGAGMPSDGYPYFQVECEPCRRQSVQWERRLFGADAAAVLSAPHSEAVRLNIARRLGWDALPGNNYQLLREPGSLLLRGAGRGHGVGLCQSGAARMATSGVPFASVLAYYFPNTIISRQRR
jgi:stage II sporulation protein D